MALYEIVNNHVHTVNNNFVTIRALNADDSEAFHPFLPHGASDCMVSPIKTCKRGEVCRPDTQAARNKKSGKQASNDFI